ncbi:MAG: hypothetical protein EBR52_06165 [Microbacteriaceae bacterium]|nr:hypothetical protein [Microbacteriaceae bacterium]
MEALLYGNLTNGSLTETIGGTAFDWPVLTEGDTVKLALRLVARVDESELEVYPTVNTVKLSLGRVDARPTAGSFALRLRPANTNDSNDTATLAYNVTAAAMQTAINNMITAGLDWDTATPPTSATVELVDQSYVIRLFRNGAPFTEAVRWSAAANTLEPSSWVRAYSMGGTDANWEVRLTQSPIAFADIWARVAPDPPAIASIREGGEDSDVLYNEIQSLTVPANFRGAYYLQRPETSVKSGLLSIEDGPDEIAAAIAPLADEGGEFVVTNPVTDSAYIEFAGEMGGIDHDLLNVFVVSAPPGDLTVEMSLATAEVGRILRAAPLVEGLALEVEVGYEGPDEEPRVWTYRGTVSLQRDIIDDSLATAQNIDWLRPPLPVDYIPFVADQVITGNQHYEVVIGDGETENFTIDHELDTEALHVTLRENAAGGEILTDGFTVSIDSANSISVDFVDPPDEDGIAVLITSAGPVSAFQAHNHTIAQIETLQTILDGLGERISDLEDLAPSGVLASPEAIGYSSEWTLPTIFEVYPTKQAVEVSTIADLVALPKAELPKIGGLLPAVHDATTEALPSPLPLPSPSHIGRVFQNQTGSTVILPGGLGRKGVQLKANEFAASDGRVWYRVERFDTGSSYYPSDFTRELFSIFVNEQQLRLRTEFSLQFAVETAVVNSNTNCQWVVVVETGTAPQDSSPGTPGLNLQNVVWSATPALTQRLIVTPVSCRHLFGVRVKRSLISNVDTLTLDLIRYGASSAGTAPASANFAIRGRLVRFDTENSASDARGLIALAGLTIPGDAGSEFPDVGRAIIRG